MAKVIGVWYDIIIKRLIMVTIHKKDWWEKAVFYELYVDKFAGNFKNLIDKIPYLKGLGIDCVHILPYYPSPMADAGYDISNYRNVRPELGTLSDFENFVKSARKENMHVMVNLVLNHTSTQHPWFIKAASNPRGRERRYFLWSKTGDEFKGAINAFPHLKSQNWIYNQEAGAYYFSTFYPEQADLNWDNPAVFQEICSIIDFLASLGVSAFRLDAVSHLVKREGSNCKGLPETHDVIKRIRKYINEKHPDTMILGEVYDTTERMLAYFGKGDECHLLYHFPFATACALSLVLDKSDLLKEIIEQIGDTPPHTAWLAFLRHHDELSLALLPKNLQEELLRTVDPDSQFNFTDGVSLRLQNLCRSSRVMGQSECVKKAFQTLFSAPAPALLYYGDEIGMINVPLDRAEKDTRIAVRGRFDWQEASRQMGDRSSLFHYVRRLIHERNV